MTNTVSTRTGTMALGLCACGAPSICDVQASRPASRNRLEWTNATFVQSQLARMASDYAARWIFLAGCALVIGLWLCALGITVPFAPILHKLPFPAILLVLWAVLHWLPRYRVPMAGCADLCLSGFQLCFILLVLIP